MAKMVSVFCADIEHVEHVVVRNFVEGVPVPFDTGQQRHVVVFPGQEVKTYGCIGDGGQPVQGVGPEREAFYEGFLCVETVGGGTRNQQAGYKYNLPEMGGGEDPFPHS